jgi:hypothetical protein
MIFIPRLFTWTKFFLVIAAVLVASKVAVAQQIVDPPCEPPPPGGVIAWEKIGRAYDYEFNKRFEEVRTTKRRGSWTYGFAFDCIYAPCNNPPIPSYTAPKFKSGTKTQVCWKLSGGADLKVGGGLIMEALAKLELTLRVGVERNECTEASAEVELTSPMDACWSIGLRSVWQERSVRGTATFAESATFWDVQLPSGLQSTMATYCNTYTVSAVVESLGENIRTQIAGYPPTENACFGYPILPIPENEGATNEPCCPGYLCPSKMPPPLEHECCKRVC